MSPKKCSLLVHLLSFALCSLCLSCSAFTTQQYKEALEKSILFFEGQRSGGLPRTQRMGWRANSALKDGSAANVDLEGGYYDAGDNVKFGLPMAFTTTLLSWGAIEFGSSMGDQLDYAEAAIRWGTDYLIKASTQTPNTLYVQVGDPSADHTCWERPEDMDTPRSVYSVTPENPGSEVAAETAAALAAASIVFKRSDPSYSRKLLQTAALVFDFADKNRGAYDSGSIHSAVCPFYCSYSGYQDELLWGASWLYRASGDGKYLNYIQANGIAMGSQQDDMSFSWDDKRAGNKILLFQLFSTGSVGGQSEMYKSHSDSYICSLLKESPSFQGQFTPGGLFYKDTASNLQYATTMTMLLLTYAKYLSASGKDVVCGGATFKPDRLVSLAKQQVDYIMGDNPAKMSYMVGFGPKFPLKVHHRGSSIPSVRSLAEKIACQDGMQYFHSPSPNPNQLTGAIVGGPDRSDNYNDERDDFEEAEPATYINAAFVAAAAYFSAAPN